MDFSRIQSAIDVERTQKTHVAVVGVGGSAGLVKNLVRCGVKRLTLIDPDKVEPNNLARQDHRHDQLNEHKAQALARLCKAINPQTEATPLARDFTAMNDREVDDHLGKCDLLVLATDSFKAQARGNEVALRLGIPALWIGLYPRGLGGEIAFWHSRLNACFRCLMSNRYKAQEKAIAAGLTLDPPSDGATIFDVELVDAIAGQIAIGLLTMGALNRFGRLMGQLGDRNFIQVRIAPDYAIGGRDLVQEHLGVADGNDAYFAWNTIVLRDPTGHLEVCPDCQRFRGDKVQSGKRIAGDSVGRLVSRQPGSHSAERKKGPPLTPNKL